MDRSYYYRVLGLQPGATNKQIREAFEERMERLASPDYADDPEYVAKKMNQAKYAYSVLMGSVAPITKAQRKKDYECYKDDIEEGRDSDHFKEKHSARSKNLDAAVAAANVKRKVQSAFGGAELPKGLAKFIVAIGLVILLSIVSVVVELVSDFSDYSEPDYSVIEEMDKEFIEKNDLAVERVLYRDAEYDFFGLLSSADYNEADIQWDPYNEDVYSRIWGLNHDLAYAMGIHSVEHMMTYWTGDDKFYWNNDDLEISVRIADVMGAPYFEEVAGKMDITNGKVIYNYADYMEFLITVAEMQTDLICSEPPIEYYD